MGKDKNKALRGPKYNPSSSGEAGSLMSSGSGFIGFSAFTNSLSNATDPDYYQVDPQYQVLLKKLQKKDSVSRLKALEELNKLFTDINIEGLDEFNLSSLKSLLHAWEFMYKRLVNDDDRYVRDLASQCLGTIGSKVGKHLGAHMKTLLGPWLFAICDRKDQSNNTALQSFNNIFPEKKRKDVLLFGHDKAIEYLCENLQETPNTIGDSKSVAPEILQERYERCISNSLLAIEYLIDKTTTDNNNDSNNNSTTTTTTTTNTKTISIEIYENIFQAQFFTFFSSKSSLIRKTSYRVLGTIINKVHGYVDKNFKEMSSKVLGIFSEKDSSTHLYMWEAIISFCKRYGDQAWEGVDARKHVLPRFWALLRSGCFGSYELSYPSISPFLTFIPTSVVGQGTGFFKEFFSNLYKGVEVLDTYKQFSNPNNPTTTPLTTKASDYLLVCYLECIIYSVKKYAVNDKDVNDYLVNGILESLITDYFNLETSSWTEGIFVKKIYNTLKKLSSFGNENQSIQQSLKLLFNNVGKEIQNQLYNNNKVDKEISSTSGPINVSKITPIQIDTLLHRLSLLLSITNITTENTTDDQSSLPFIDEFIQSLFKESCKYLQDNNSNNTIQQENSIKCISTIICHYSSINNSLLMTTSSGNDDNQFFNNTIIPSLEQSIANDNKELITSLISIVSKLFDPKSFDKILSIFEKNGISSFRYLITLLENIHSRDKLVNHIDGGGLNSIIKSICNLSNQDNDNDNDKHHIIKELLSIILFNQYGDYNCLINQDTLSLVLKWQYDLIQYSYNTILNIPGLTIDILPYESYSMLLFKIPFDKLNQDQTNLIENLLKEWTCLIIHLLTTTNYEQYSQSLGSIINSIFNTKYNNPSISNSILSILFNHILNNNYSNIKLLSKYTIDLIKNNNESLEYLLFNLYEKSSIDGIENIRFSLSKYNITPLNSVSINQCKKSIETKLINTFVKIQQFILITIHSLGYEKVFKSLENSILLGELVGGVVSLDSEIIYPVNRKSIDSEIDDLEQFINNEYQTMKNEFFNSLIELYSNNMVQQKWFTHLLDKQSQDNVTLNYSIILLVLFNYINDSSNDDLKHSVTSHLAFTSGTVNSSGKLNLIQSSISLLVSVESQFIEQLSLGIYKQLNELPLSIPNSFELIGINVALLSTIISNSTIQLENYTINQEQTHILLKSLQTFQQWYHRINGPLMKDQEHDFQDKMEPALLSYLLIVCQSIVAKDIYLSSNQSLLIQSCLESWINQSSITSQYSTYVQYQSTKLLNFIITGDNQKYIIPSSLGEQFILDKGNALLVLWVDTSKQLDKMCGYGFLCSEFESLLELYYHCFKKIPTNIGFKLVIGSDKLDSLFELSCSHHKYIQTTSICLLESYFLETPIEMVKVIEINQHQDPTFIFFNSKFESILLNFDLWKEFKNNRDSKYLLTKGIGILMLWDLLLKYYSNQDISKKSNITDYLNVGHKVSNLLGNIFTFAKKDGEIGVFKDLASFPYPTNEINYREFQPLCSFSIYSFVNHLPNMVRRWADECPTKITNQVNHFITHYISPIIIKNEITRVNNYKAETLPSNDSNFQAKGSTSTREVIASYEKDEMTISLVLSIPETYPLRVPTVEFSKRVGVTENQWKKWLLSMTSLLLTQDGTILDACLLWKNSLDKHFEGVEVCPICYSLFLNGAIPSFKCSTCKNKFHSGCIYRWLTTSAKSTCPICSQNIN